MGRRRPRWRTDRKLWRRCAFRRYIEYVLRLFAFLGVLAAIPATAQTVPQLLATVSGTTQYREAALSPDGRYLAWTVTLKNKDNTQSPNSEIWLLDRTKNSSAVTKLTVWKHRTPSTASPGRPTAARSHSSPMPKSPASLSCTSSRPPARAVPRRRLTNLTGFLAAPAWAPDASKIALLFTENAPRTAGPLEPSTKDAGVVEEHIYEQRLTLVDPRIGRCEADHPRRYLRLRIRLGARQRSPRLHRCAGQRRQQLVDRAAVHHRGRDRRSQRDPQARPADR